MKKLLGIIFLLLLTIAGYSQSFVNVDGLKHETVNGTPTGRIVGIEVDYPMDSNINIPHVRKIELRTWNHKADLNQELFLRVNFYTPDGRKMLDAIATDSTLTKEGKAYQARLFVGYDFSGSTEDSYINPATLQLVPAGTPDAISEIALYQNITDAQAIAAGLIPTGLTSSLQRVYRVLAKNAYIVARRKGL